MTTRPKVKMSVPPRECQCGCGEYEDACKRTRGRSYLIVSGKLDEFERDCASMGCSPADTIATLIEWWLANGRRP